MKQKQQPTLPLLIEINVSKNILSKQDELNYKNILDDKTGESFDPKKPGKERELSVKNLIKKGPIL